MHVTCVDSFGTWYMLYWIWYIYIRLAGTGLDGRLSSTCFLTRTTAPSSPGETQIQIQKQIQMKIQLQTFWPGPWHQVTDCLGSTNMTYLNNYQKEWFFQRSKTIFKNVMFAPYPCKPFIGHWIWKSFAVEEKYIC